MQISYCWFCLFNLSHFIKCNSLESVTKLPFVYEKSTNLTAVLCCIRLGNVSLDIALEGYNPNTSKAMAVEQCQCPQPYKGLSCEDCAPGYYRSQTGPYGGYCVPCQCNGHSDTCDQITGICYVSVHQNRVVCRSLTLLHGVVLIPGPSLLQEELTLVICSLY